MGLLSSSSKSEQKVTNYNTSATGAIDAGGGSGSSTNLSGLTFSTGATGKNSQAGALSVTLTDQGAVAQSYTLADRAFDSIESLFNSASKSWESAAAQSAQAWDRSSATASDASAAALDAAQRAAGSFDPQKIVLFVVGAVGIIAALYVYRSR